MDNFIIRCVESVLFAYNKLRSCHMFPLYSTLGPTPMDVHIIVLVVTDIDGAASNTE